MCFVCFYSSENNCHERLFTAIKKSKYTSRKFNYEEGKTVGVKELNEACAKGWDIDPSYFRH